MEPEAISTFTDFLKKTRKEFAVQECGLILLDSHPFTEASPDAIANCSCCRNFCVEVECPYSISHTSPKDSELAFIGKVNDQFKLHIYYTQCQLQMAVTNLEKTYFVVWTRHGMIIDTITFDKELWDDMKDKLILYYKNVYLNTLFVK